MATIHANANDGRIIKFTFSGTWSFHRDATSGVAQNLSNASGTATVATGPFYGFMVVRAFFYFDTSAITGTVSGGTLSIYGYGNSVSNPIIVKSDAFGGDGGTALNNADFDAMPGFSAGNTMAGNVTTYPTGAITSWSTSGYNEFTLTAQAMTDIQNNDFFIVAMVDYDYDYLNVQPSSLGASGSFYADNSGTSKDPKIDFTEAAAGYTHTVLGITPDSMEKVKGVAKANISKVIGV